MNVSFISLSHRSTELVSHISGLPSPEEIIRAMDEISNTVCFTGFLVPDAYIILDDLFSNINL